MDAKQYLICALALSALTGAPACLADEQAPPAQAAETAAPPAAAQEEVSAGPLFEQRKQLLSEIKKAKEQGVGIAGYMSAHQSLEEQIKGGATAEQITGRIESIRKSLADQAKRSQLLKVQKPAPPQGSQVSGSGSPSGYSGAPASSSAASPPAAGGDDGGMLAKLKQKFGGDISNIPEDQIPAGLRDKLKDPAVREKLMERLKSGN